MRACCRGVPLKVGYFSEELPPYQYYDPGTKVRSGGLVDLGEMIVETMGYDVEWVDMGVTGDTIGVNSAPSYVVMVAVISPLLKLRMSAVEAAFAESAPGLFSACEA